MKYTLTPIAQKLSGYTSTLSVGDSRFFLRVYQGNKSKIYNYLVSRAMSDDTDIHSMPAKMSLDGRRLSLTVAYETAIFSLSLIQPHSASTIGFYADSAMTQPVRDNIDLQVGDNNYFILVTAQNGDSSEYSLKILRIASTSSDIVVNFPGAVIDGSLCNISLTTHSDTIDFSCITVSEGATLRMFYDEENISEITDTRNIRLSDCKTLIFITVTPAATGTAASTYTYFITCPPSDGGDTVIGCDLCGADNPDITPILPSDICLVRDENVETFGISELDFSDDLTFSIYRDSDFSQLITSNFALMRGKTAIFAKYECIKCNMAYPVSVDIYRRFTVVIGISASINSILDIRILIQEFIYQWTVIIDGETTCTAIIRIELLADSVSLHSLYDGNRAHADIYITPYEVISRDTAQRYFGEFNALSSSFIAGINDSAMAIFGELSTYLLPYGLAYNQTLLDNMSESAPTTLAELTALATKTSQISPLGTSASAWDFLSYNAWLNSSGALDIISHNSLSQKTRYIAPNKFSSIATSFGFFQATANHPISSYLDTLALLYSGKLVFSPVVLRTISRQLLDQNIRIAGLRSSSGNTPTTTYNISSMISLNQSRMDQSSVHFSLVESLFGSTTKGYLLGLDSAMIIAYDYSSADIAGNDYSDMYGELLLNAAMIVIHQNDYYAADPYAIYALSQHERDYNAGHFNDILSKKALTILRINLQIPSVSAITPHDYERMQHLSVYSPHNYRYLH